MKTLQTGVLIICYIKFEKHNYQGREAHNAVLLGYHSFLIWLSSSICFTSTQAGPTVHGHHCEVQVDLPGIVTMNMQ